MGLKSGSLGNHALEFNRYGVTWFLILFCSIMLFLNSNFPVVCYSFTMFL